MRAAILSLVLGGAACGIPAHGPTMEAGADCLECHNRGEGEPSFTVAGTLYREPTAAAGDGVKSARIHLLGADGRSVTVRSNQSGNFYTRERLAFPLLVVVEGGGLAAGMSSPVPEGGCNACHGLPPRAAHALPEPPGRVALTGGTGDELMLPGFDCQLCHRPGGAAAAFPWTASGTVFAGAAGDEGVTVTITDARGATFTRVTNRAGNFFVPEAMALGGAARVRISKGAATRLMEDPLTSGSCNACHRPGGEAEHRVSLTGGDD
jgi:hypothetical protein